MEITMLEYLAMKTGCMYLSDLKQKPMVTISLIIKRIPVETYSLHVWNDAVEYLTGHEAFCSAEEAKKYLCDEH